MANFYILASSAAGPGPLTANVTGVLGTITHTYSIPLTVKSAASFKLNVNPSQLALTPGSPKSVQVTAVSSSGPTPPVNLSVSTLPIRYDLNNPTVSGAQPGTYTLTFLSTVASQPISNFPVYITGTDGSGDTASVALPISLSVPFPAITTPTRSKAVRTGDIPAGAVYDSRRKLVFVALPNLNEVQVFSSQDAHKVASIVSSYPSSIDESGDGSKIFVGGLGQVSVIDPDILQVTQTSVLPSPPAVTTIPALQLAALSTGNVLALSGTQLYLWNSLTLAATPVNPPNFTGTARMKRSADRSKILLVSSASISAPALIYDAGSGVFGNPTVGLGGANAALNSNGSQVAVITPGGSDQGGFLNIYDGQLNLLQSEPLYNIDEPGQLIYGMDDQTFYAYFEQPDVGSVGVAYDTTTLAPRGLFSMANQAGTVAAQPLAIDESNMIFGTGTGNSAPVGTLVFTDASHPGAMDPDSSIEPNGFPLSGRCGPGPSTIGGAPFPPAPSLAFPAPVCLDTKLLNGLRGTGFDNTVQYSLFVGAPPASADAATATGVSVVSTAELDFQLPSSIPNNATGAVDLTLTRPDGWYQIIPEAFSYGPTALFVDPNVLSPGANNTLTILGYALDSAQVTVGGKAVTVLSSGPYDNNIDGIFPLQELQVTAPPAAVGPSDVVITTEAGSVTLPGAVQYLSSVKVYPITGGLGSVIYDQPRQRLYISNTDHNQVEIFSLGSQTWLPPVRVGNSPTSLSLSPDGTKLVALNSTDGTISVIDPSQAKVVATYSGYTAQDQANCPGFTPLGYSAVALQSHLAGVALGCPFVLHLMNLDTGAISCSGWAGCDSSGTNLNTGLVASALASSPDGSELFISGGFSPVAMLNLAQNKLTTNLGIESQGWSAAINADGNLFASTLAVYDSLLEPTTRMSGVGYFSTENELDLGGGEAFNPSGSLLFLPSSGIDIFDVRRGRLALRVGLPEPPTIPRPSSIAVDETGSRIFVLTRSGVTIAQLAKVPLSLATVQPSSGAVGTKVTIRGSGFENGTTLVFGATAATATFVDGMTLTATVPNVARGPVRATVSNPGGEQYPLNAAFLVK